MESEKSDLGYNTEKLRAIAQGYLEGDLIKSSKLLSKAYSEKSMLRGNPLKSFKSYFFLEYKNAFETLRSRGMMEIGTSFGKVPLHLSLLPARLEDLSVDLSSSSRHLSANINQFPEGRLAKAANNFSGVFTGEIKPDYVSNSRAMNKIMKINDLEKANDAYKSVRKDLESKGFDVSLFPESMYGFVKSGGNKE